MHKLSLNSSTQLLFFKYKQKTKERNPKKWWWRWETVCEEKNLIVRDYGKIVFFI
jgi:hypothetical protein